MIQFDIEAVRADVRAMAFVRGTPAEVEGWRFDHRGAVASLAIEDAELSLNEAALFDMLLDEAVPPELTTAIVARLLGGNVEARI